MSVSIRTKITEVLFNVQEYYAKGIHFSNDNKKIIIEVKQIFESWRKDFLSIFDYRISRQEAHIKIMKWVSLVTMLLYPSLMSFAKKVIKRIQKILNWFDDPISNGKAEGINNTIKTLLKRAYGYKDFDYFRMKVLQKCGYL